MPTDPAPAIVVSIVAASIITLLAILITRPIRTRLVATFKPLVRSKLSSDDLMNRARLRRSVGEIALAIEDAGPRERGKVMALFNGSFNAGWALSSMGLGLLAERAGYPIVFVVASVVAFLGVGLLAAGRARRPGA